MHDDPTEWLRSELLRRVEVHPVRSWSPPLLAAMIAVFDLAAPELPLQPPKRPTLTLVR